MRAIVFAAFILGCGAASPAVCPVPEACPTCAAGQPPPDAGVLPSGNMLGERWGELSPTIATHMTLVGNLEPHLRAGGGFEFAKGHPRNDRFRFLLATNFSGGAWGDQQHGAFDIDTGLGFRLSVAGDLTLIDVYLQATEGLIFGFGGLTGGRSYEMGNVAAIGVGLRLFRTFSVELTGGATYAFDTPFKATDGTTTNVVPEFGLAVRFDLCSSLGTCNYAPQQQKTEDVTCGLYLDAQDICTMARGEGEKAHGAFCATAVNAMSIKDSGDPVLAREAVAHFLADLAASEAGTPRAQKERELASTNTCLMSWRSCGRRQECLMSQQGQKPDSRRMYSPYVLELLAALGCTADGKARSDCNYTCDVPARKPAVCAQP